MATFKDFETIECVKIGKRCDLLLDHTKDGRFLVWISDADAGNPSLYRGRSLKAARAAFDRAKRDARTA